LVGLLENSGAVEIRAAAAGALEAATSEGVVEALARAAQEDLEATVRIQALRSLSRRAKAVDGRWLKEII
jgi:hypothetical protein